MPAGTKHGELVERALRDLEGMPTRDLIRAARVLERTYQHDAAGMFRFAGPFRSFAFARTHGEDPWFARYELSAAILLADGSVAGRLADASEPFWRHVREAVL